MEQTSATPEIDPAKEGLEIEPPAPPAPAAAPGGRRQPSAAMIASEGRRFNRDLAAAPDDGVVKIDKDTAIKAAKKLGWSNKKWGVAGMRAVSELGGFLNQPIELRKILATQSMNTLEQIEMAIEAGSKLARGESIDPESKVVIPAADRAKAIQAVALAAQAHNETCQHLLKMAESAYGKESLGGGAPTPTNKPPNFGLRVTSPDGSVTEAIASSGATP